MIRRTALRPTVPLFRLDLEFAAWLIVVSVVLAVLVPAATSLTTKTRLTEMILATTSVRSDMIEAAAHSGNYAVSTRSVRHVGVTSIEDALALKQLAADRPQAGLLGTGARSATYYEKTRIGFDYVVEGGTLAARGTIEGRPYRLPFAMAVAGDGPIASVLWLCGDTVPPPGWIALRGPEGTDVPEGRSFHVCRQRGAF